MSHKNYLKSLFYKTKEIIELVLSISGYVPKNATFIRSIFILLSIYFIFNLTKYFPKNLNISVTYFLISLVLYIVFITLILREKGYRLNLIKRYGEEKAYLIYEGILGFLFFNGAASIGYITSSTKGELFNFLNDEILLVICILMFSFGFIVKLWAAKVTSIDIYYWKDMFLGRKISKFVVIGPYKYFSNPMYGIGQLGAYATAIYYQSIYGLFAALLYQVSVFTFYFAVEKKFIERVYMKNNSK